MLYPLSYGRRLVSIASAGDIGENDTSWVRDLTVGNLSPRTTRSYHDSTHLLRGFLLAEGMSTNVASISREHVQAFITDRLARGKPTTGAVHFSAFRCVATR